MSDTLIQIAARNSEARRKSTFVAQTAAFQTGVADHAAVTTFDATKAIMNIYNTASRSAVSAADKNQWIIPLKLLIVCRSIPTATTSVNVQAVLDAADRYSSGGVLLTSQQTSRDTQANWAKRTQKARIYAGALTLAAATDAEDIGATQLKSAIPVADDAWVINFGGEAAGDLPRMDIGPGCNLSLHPITPAQSAAGAYSMVLWYLETQHPSDT